MADERDPLDALRDSNPCPPSRDPDPREALRASAVAEEILLSPNDQSDTAPRHAQGARRLLVLASAAAAGVLIVALVVSTRDNRSGSPVAAATSPTTTTDRPLTTSTEPLTTNSDGPMTTSPGGPIGAASCVEQYSLGTLANRSLAFDGTVETADASTVTFRVSQWFRGGDGDTVTLESNGLAGGVVSSNSSGVTLEVGGRYLVAGERPFVWGCGFTQAYEPNTAAEWATAFQA